MSPRCVLIFWELNHENHPPHRRLRRYWQGARRALDAEGYHLLLLDLDPLSLEALDGELRGDHTLVPFDLWRSG